MTPSVLCLWFSDHCQYTWKTSSRFSKSSEVNASELLKVSDRHVFPVRHDKDKVRFSTLSLWYMYMKNEDWEFYDKKTEWHLSCLGEIILLDPFSAAGNTI